MRYVMRYVETSCRCEKDVCTCVLGVVALVLEGRVGKDDAIRLGMVKEVVACV